MNRIGGGYIPLRRVTVLGARLHVHWSAVALAGVMLAVWHRQPAYAIEAIACYFGLILLHEAGHAAMALRLGYHASDIHLSMIHGLCTYDSPGTLREDAMIAWGGVLAQMAVAFPLLALAQVHAIASLSFVGIAVAAFGYFSLSIAALNLVPSRGLDGAKAWRLLPILAADVRAQGFARASMRLALKRSSDAFKDARPPIRTRQESAAVGEAASREGTSARWMARECGRLSNVGATWPEIANVLNPQHDRQMSELIQRVRASYMAVPLQGLEFIETACLAALADDTDASGIDAVNAAIGELGTLAKARW